MYLHCIIQSLVLFASEVGGVICLPRMSSGVSSIVESSSLFASSPLAARIFSMLLNQYMKQTNTDHLIKHNTTHTLTHVPPSLNQPRLSAMR